MSEGKPSGADQSTSNGGGGGTANGSVQPECENEGGGVQPECENEGGGVQPECENEGGGVQPECENDGGGVQPECENEGGGGSSMGADEMSHEYPAGIETIGNGYITRQEEIGHPSPLLEVDDQPLPCDRGMVVNEHGEGGIQSNLLPRKEPIASARDLLTPIRDRLFPDDRPRIPDIQLFQEIMLEFCSFEEECGDQEEASRVFKFLSGKCEQTFAKDFPLYIVLSHHCKMVDCYHCDDFERYVEAVITNFENLPVSDVATTLNGFVASGDFKVCVNSKHETLSAFVFLEAAFNKFMMDEKRGASYRIYPMILWAAAYLKFSTLTQRAQPRFWYMHWMEESEKYPLNIANIEGAKQGMLLIEALKLPADLMFSARMIGELLAPDNTAAPRSLYDQWNAVSQLGSCTVFDDLDQFIKHVVIRLREHCGSLLKKKPQGYLNKLTSSANSTRVGAVTDGLKLLDAILQVITIKKWRMEELDDEIRKWLQVLLNLGGYFGKESQDCLRKFLSDGYCVTRRFHDFILKQIVEEMQQKMNKKKVQKFCSLYAAFEFWPDQLVQEYLERTPVDDVKLSEIAWKDLFTKVVERLPGASRQRMLHSFLQRVATSYASKRQPGLFIIDLMKLGVPTLFSVCSADDKEVVAEFKDAIRVFIRTHLLKAFLHQNTKNILSSVSGRQNKFQEMVLSIVQMETVPQSKDLQEYQKFPVRHAVDYAVGILRGNFIWVKGEQSLQQKFCLNFINACCSRIPMTPSSFDWMLAYSQIICRIGDIFCSFALNTRALGKQDDVLPPDATKYPSFSVRQYFEWVQKLHSILSNWKNKLESQDAKYDDIVSYKLNHRHVHKLAEAVSAPRLVVPAHVAVNLKQTFLEHFEELNLLLLKRFPSDPMNWCSVISLLDEHEVELPPGLYTALRSHILFPNENGDKAVNMELLTIVLPPPTGVHLQLYKHVTLLILKELINHLTIELEPITQYMEVLVHFRLHPSHMFDTYLHNALKSVQPAEQSTGNSVSALGKALTSTVQLLEKVMQGTATYREVVADGLINLQTLDVDKEFDTLCRSPQSRGCSKTSFVGLLKLIKFSDQAPAIHKVCKQFDQHSCLKDPKLLRILDLARQLKSNESKLTICEADAQWFEILQLCGFNSEITFDKCLQVFLKVAENTDFCNFVKDQQFNGVKGDTFFKQQFQLITAQLQHEEYDETVLNHLYAAFSFVAPFRLPASDFPSLLLHMVDLDATSGFAQLKTVKKNMHLIRLWFTKAKGDTTENVSAELKCILTTGFYRITPSPTPETCLSLRVVLEYDSPYAKGSVVEDDIEKLPPTIQWKVEQINDFVHRLGFLSGQHAQKVEDFLYLNEIAYRLLNLFSKLKEMGHAEYSKKDFKYSLRCSTPVTEASEEVATAERTWTTWSGEVEKLHNSYKWLLFFNIPKLMNLYELLIAKQCNTPRIIQEICVLFRKDQATKQLLFSAVEQVLTQRKSDLPAVDLESPLDVVGSFLTKVLCFEGDILHPSLLPKRYIAHSDEPLNRLYSTPNFNQSHLVQLIIQIYGGPPEPYEVLHCLPTTNGQQLKLFMKRVVKHPRQYLVLEVNRLPYLLQEILLQLYLDFKNELESTLTRIYFIETAASVFRELPWLKPFAFKKEEFEKEFEKVAEDVLPKGQDDNFTVELVYGPSGDGKSHYITHKMIELPKDHWVTIAVNEAFSCGNAIEKLHSLDCDASGGAMYFNFTIFPPDDAADELLYKQLLDKIGWFFFDLLILGYVEDPLTGMSFHFPANQSWMVYIEVPCGDVRMDFEESLQTFRKDIPALGLLGHPRLIDSAIPYCIDADVQLVCKYLKAYKYGYINREYKEGGRPVKFSQDDNLPEDECRKLLTDLMPEHVKRSNNKMTQKLFIHYMKRRCIFLDNSPDFNYKQYSEKKRFWQKAPKLRATAHLGSILMETMLKEVSDFCDPSIAEGWSQRPHQQLIYDYQGGSGTIGLICLQPERLPIEDKRKFEDIGVKIPEDLDAGILHEYLSRALSVPLKDVICVMDESKYVLTVDYTLKMLNIHERYECGIPVIIEGETGVGKTALVEMLSKLWNLSWHAIWRRIKGPLLVLIQTRMGDIYNMSLSEAEEACIDAVYDLTAGKTISDDTVMMFIQLHDEGGHFATALSQELMKLERDPVFSVLEIPLQESQTLLAAFSAIKTEDSLKNVAHLLQIVLSATVKGTYYKLNVHASLSPQEIKKFFNPVFKQAHELQQSYDDTRSQHQNLTVPFVTVYLDEINTASCLGLFKEIIVDRTIDGQPIPNNVFIIAACNPHRGDGLVALGHPKFSWVKGSYYVRRLHPTLQFLMWDYGSLNELQEREYVSAKMAMMSTKMMPEDVGSLTDLIVQSQCRMREYALEEFTTMKTSENIYIAELEVCANSSVSQRDIQRVFTFYQWLMNLYGKLELHHETSDKHHRHAVMVSLGLVYFLRLSSKYRPKYRAFLDSLDHMADEVTFSEAFQDELEYYINRVELPPGIAKTEALKENVFAIIACTVTHTPLIIVGEPGSSKTLSFNIAISNLKGKESVVDVFQETDVFPSLDPHFYQCSHRTTSNEVGKVFNRAINRQRTLATIIPVHCVVFMDEAGLPEEKLESLKVLHYHLDAQEVSFVAISNSILDAAKSNRAVSVFRPEASNDDLQVLASECIAIKNPTKNLVGHFCSSYENIRKVTKLFGLRDFIHFITYLRCKYTMSGLEPQFILESLERNFNGSDAFAEISFKEICDIFFGKLGVSMETLHHRSILDILKSSLSDCGNITSEDVHGSIQSDTRYKLIIDPSEDDSLVRLLFTYGVLKREKTRLYICSDFYADDQTRVNTIAQIKHSVSAGHTILMCQTDEIHENFYDLFNQRFRTTEDPEHGVSCYANIAIGTHTKPCYVHRDFQCVVVIKKSDIDHTPAPFLDRFEKYCLSHESLFETVCDALPPCLRILLQTVHSKIAQFIQCVSQANLYGCTNETLHSLMLTVLPPSGHEYKPMPMVPKLTDGDDTEEIIDKLHLLKILVGALRDNAGFQLPDFSDDELAVDGDHIFQVLLKEEQFKAMWMQLKKGDTAALVDEALHLLHHAPASNGRDSPVEIYDDSCMVIAVLLQWLISYLCKRLMQLLTPEALIVQADKIPTYYLQNYLDFQEHFCLKDLVKRQFDQLCRSGWKASSCATKLLCFTRSSTLIHQLPTKFPCTTSTTAYKTTLSEHVYDDLEHLMVYKVSLSHSQSEIEKLLRKFVSADATLLLLIANMTDISIKMINHLRIMIEEAESQSKKGEDERQSKKLFILLLHFPPVMFLDSCYPSLFLQGWDHHYLDTIAHATLTQRGVKAVLNIKLWFKDCCFPALSSPNGNEQMVETLMSILKEAIPIIASRTTFYSKETGLLNQHMSASDRSKVVRKLFFNKHLGVVLATKFAKYWTPRVKQEHMWKVTRFLYSYESTLNITDSIQAMFQSSFYAFLVYILNKMNEEFNTDILLGDDSPALEELFKSLLERIPVPDLTQLKVMGETLHTERPRIVEPYRPKFPFFKYVSETMEKVVDACREKVNQQIDTLCETEHHTPALVPSDYHIQKVSKQDKLKLYSEAAKSSVLTIDKENCLGVTAEAMDRDHTRALWERYYNDFEHYMMHLEESPESKVNPLMKQILEAYIGAQLTSSSVLDRLISLHVHLHVNRLDVNKLTRVLKPISRVQQELDAAPVVKLDLLTQAEFLDSQSALFLKMPPSLAALVVKTLYKSLDESKEDEGYYAWYRCYYSIMSMPALQQDILGTLPSSIESQLNILHATYLVMECCFESTNGLSAGRKLFRHLQSKHFGDGVEDKKSPRLCEVVTTSLKELEVPSSGSGESYCLKSFIRGMFDFFFSAHRAQFSQEDFMWFLEIANQQCFSRTSSQTIAKKRDPLKQCASLHVFKFYLSRLLGQSKKGILQLFLPQRRECVGKVLTAAGDEVGGSPGPYIPTFYQGISAYEASKNLMMQQPLAHLYFMTVLEHLQPRRYGTTYLVRLTTRIDELCGKSSPQETVLLCIEKQAIIQMILQKLGSVIGSKIKDWRNDIPVRCIEGINELLSKSTGGSSTILSGHALVLAMQLLKNLNSTSQLVQMLNEDNQHTLIGRIKCASTLQSLIPTRDVSEAHLFPFLDPDEKPSHFTHLYQKICKAMTNIKDNPESVKALDYFGKIVSENHNNEIAIRLYTPRDSLSIPRKQALKMSLWLCTYYKFFCIKENHSEELAEKVGTKLREVLNDELQFVGIIESFLHPKYMIVKPECPDVNGVVVKESLELGRDPIFELFNPLPGTERDPSDVQLCHAIVNMVAVVLASEPRSNHLWYHMFAADALQDTYMTGFMYDAKVSEGCLYDCGVELTAKGRYGRPDYLLRANKGPLSLHSFYLMLWANFAAFSIALLTQQDAQQKMVSLISKSVSVRHFCVSQLRSVWKHMQDNMGLLLEEQSFFIMKCMHTFMEACTRSPKLVQGGLFQSSEALCAYEKTWHEHIFAAPFHKQLADYRRANQSIDLLRKISYLRVHYPHFSTRNQFLHDLLSLDTPSEAGGCAKDPVTSLYVLKQFALQYPRLEAAGALLPDLIEFYQWIHTDLAFLVQKEYAKHHEIEEVIETFKPHASIDISKLYEKVRVCYNEYVEVIHHKVARGGVMVSCITDATTFSHFLSDEEDLEDDHDLLYLVIEDIVNFHNEFLRDIYQAVASPHLSALQHYLQRDHQHEDLVYPAEVNEHMCIIGNTESCHGIVEYLQLIRSRFLQPTDGSAVGESWCNSCNFDFEQLQKEVIKTFVIGKPRIRPPSQHLRRHFDFRSVPQADTVSLNIAETNLEGIKQYIIDKPEFTSKEMSLTKQIECEFHSADYNTLMEIATGLRAATEYLIKALVSKDPPEVQLETMVVPEFLHTVYKTESKNDKEIMKEIGIGSLSSSRLSCLLKLKLPYLYSTLELFVQWIKDGVYDFHHLPLVMKKHLEPQDHESLPKLLCDYNELQWLQKILVLSESRMRKSIQENMQVPITEFLGLTDEKCERLVELIHNTVQCQHYVALRVLIRRQLRETCTETLGELEAGSSIWEEFTPGLWDEKGLKHLRDTAVPYDRDPGFMYNPDKQMYGFQVGNEPEKPVLTHTDTEDRSYSSPQPPPTQSAMPVSKQQASDTTEEQLERAAEQLTVDDVSVYLRSIKMERYSEEFATNDIDGPLMLALKDGDLMDFGIDNGFHRRKILSKFKPFLLEKHC